MRCLKLLKPYGQKDVEEEEDDENNDEDGDAPVKRNVLAEPRVIERDVLTQAYDIGQNALQSHDICNVSDNCDHICDNYKFHDNYNHNDNCNYNNI